jgi:hypothetical protein
LHHEWIGSNPSACLPHATQFDSFVHAILDEFSCNSPSCFPGTSKLLPFQFPYGFTCSKGNTILPPMLGTKPKRKASTFASNNHRPPSLTAQFLFFLSHYLLENAKLPTIYAQFYFILFFL